MPLGICQGLELVAAETRQQQIIKRKQLDVRVLSGHPRPKLPLKLPPMQQIIVVFATKIVGWRDPSRQDPMLRRIPARFEFASRGLGTAAFRAIYTRRFGAC